MSVSIPKEAFLLFRDFVKLGIIPEPVGLVDLQIFAHAVERKEFPYSLEHLKTPGQQKLFTKLWLQMRDALKDSLNQWTAGEEYHHDPTESEAVLHFSRHGGAQAFALEHPEFA